jgi:hypothetical protein
MFGWGVPQAERFSDILEERIVGLEVWNRAVNPHAPCGPVDDVDGELIGGDSNPLAMATRSKT